MQPEDMVSVNLAGAIVEGKWQPSCDTAIHLVLCRAFSENGGIAHTYSCFATVFAQAGKGISAFSAPMPMIFMERFSAPAS